MINRFLNSVVCLTLAVSISAPTLAQAQEPPTSAPGAPHVEAQTPPATPPATPPSKGVGYLIAGRILLGLGVLNLITMPVCRESKVFASSDSQESCLVGSAISAGVLVAISVPLLAIAEGKAKKYQEWQAAAPATAGFSLSAGKGQLALSFGGQF